MSSQLERPSQPIRQEQLQPLGGGEAITGEVVSVATTDVAQRETLERLLGLDLGLPESAEQKLNELTTEVVALSAISAQVSLELYQREPDKFRELTVEIQQRMSKIEIYLQTFVTTVEIQYPKVTALQKFVIALIALVRGTIKEATLMRTLGDNPAKRAALLGSEQKFQTFLATQKQQLEAVKAQVQAEIEKPLRLRQQELLSSNERYQELIKFKKKAELHLEQCNNETGKHGGVIALIVKEYFSVSKNFLLIDSRDILLHKSRVMIMIKNRLKGFDEEMASITATAWNQAEREVLTKEK